MSITVLVPAHNEAAQIGQTIASLHAQTQPPETIVVVADNCTDSTAAIAASMGVLVLETVGNTHKKAGALNQGWARYARHAEYVFTMDADTVLAPNFFELALALMEADPDLGGACACPMLKPMPQTSAWGRTLWRMGRLDFGGYMRLLCRWKFSPEVLFGYGTILRSSALERVAAGNACGMPWATDSIVEDYKVSIDLRRLGYRLSIIPGALAYTDVPLTLRELWVQRMRWAGGTWQELARAGWQPYTRKVWLTALGCVGAAVLRVLALTAWVVVLCLHMDVAWSWWWLTPLVVSVLDRADMVRYSHGADWKDLALAASLVPMELMSVLREGWTLWSAWVVGRRRNLAW